MKILCIILLSVAIVTVTARHRKEWQRVDPFKISRERLQTFYKSNVPACTRGAGFYRDPQDCHQFVRCVDEFGNGRHFSVFVGRCEPGLVFDENVSACNWPELAAPCSDSPQKLQDTRKPFRPQQVAQDNVVYEEKKWDKQYPVQQQVVQEQQGSDAYEQPEVPVVQEIQIAAQVPVQQDKYPQVLVETQTSEKPFEENEQKHEENVQEPETQEIREPEGQKQVQQENLQEPEIQEQNFEDVASIQQPVQSEQHRGQEVQQIIYQEPNNENIQNGGSRPGQVSSNGFQQVVDQQAQQFVISYQTQPEHSPQREAQSEWWVPEDNPQPNPPRQAGQVQTSEVNEEPIFCSHEGFYRHPENCSQFVRCVKIQRGAYAVHFFECPKQLMFDEKDSACIVGDIHSCRSSTRKKRQASNTNLQCRDEGFFRHPADCRAFYRCVKTSSGSYETHPFSCPANLVFDEEYTTCNWPEKAPPCNNRIESYNPTRKPVQPQRSQYKQPSQTTNRESWTTRKPGNDYIDKSITLVASDTYGRRKSTEGPKVTTQSYETGPKCRSEGFFRNDNDCTKFFKCIKKGNSFIRYELACPKNFAYDDGSKKCVAQRYVASCHKNKQPYPPRQDDEETTVSSQSSSTQSSNSESGNDNIVCEREGYFRHPEDCNRFYRCVDFSGNGEEFVRYDFNCPEGLVFDEANSVCNWPDQSAPCDTSGNGGGGTGGEGDGGSETGENESGGNDENDGRNPENENSTPGEQSSTESAESTTSSSSGSNGESGSENESGDSGSGECTKEGYYRNPDDCNKFYRCVDFNGEGKEFVRYDFSCPEGLVFDEVNSVCNWPAESEPCDTRSSGGNEGGNDRDGSGTTASDAPDRGSESTEQSQNPSQGTTPSSNESSSRAPDENPSSDSGSDDSQSTTQSPGEGSTKSGGSGGEGNSGECTEEGFFRNPDDCNKFYRCVDHNGDGQQFVKYDFTCPEGLVFDEVNSVCNWPDQSAPCDGGSQGQRSTSSGSEDGSESSQTSTSSSRSSTQEAERTTESSASSTTERGSQTSDSGESSSSTTERPTSSSSDGDASGSTRGGSGGNQGECTEEGYFRNPEDCTKFYRCVDYNGDGQQFVKYDFECPDGLVFDEVNSVCNWPDQSAPCDSKDGGSSTSQPESSSEGSQSSTERPTQDSRETTQSSTESSEDSSECKEPGFYRCRDDCSKFYRCVDENGKLVRYDFKCPDGLIFDDKKKKCDWPSSELTCDTESSTSSGTTSSEQSSTTASSTQSSTSSSSSGSSNKECTEEGFFRNPDDCTKYYRCIDEGDGTFTREDFSCAEDEVFDEEMRYCNRKDLAPPCDDSQSTSSQTTTTQRPTSSQTTTTRRPTSSQTTTTQRPTTTQTTTTQRPTTSQSSTESSTKSGDDSKCTEPGFFRCRDDCTKFYRCVEENGDLVRYDFECPDGLIFDDRNDKCDWPSEDLTCDTGSSSSSDSQTSGTTSSTGTTSSSGSTSSSNGCTEEGFFRNPDDCSKYYRCIDEGDGTLTREDFDCAEDEVFDEEMRYCNRKDLAPPCDEDSSTTESSSGGSSTQSSSESTSSGSSSSGECQEEGFHRDPNDCSKFYRCVDFQGDGKSFTRYDFDCPEGLVFDESNDVCNWPSSVPSCESSGGSGGSTGSGSSTESSSTSTSGSSTSSTRSSEQTTSTRSSEQTTTRSSEQTSSTRSSEQTSSTRSSEQTTSTTPSERGSTGGSGESGASTSSESGTTPSSTSASSTSGESTTSRGGGGSSDNIECTEEGFFRHPDDCNKFYRCVDFAGTGESFVRYDFDCPEGLVFDEVNSVCNWPNMSPSCESGSRGGSDGNGSDSSDSSDGASQDTSTTPQDQTTSSSSTSSSSDEFQCKEEGYFKHPSDCKKYYECKRDEETGELVKIDCECPDGQVWDNEGWYCNAEDLSPPCDGGSSSSFKCTEEGFFRDTEDCTKYYQCNRTGPGENDFTSEHHQCEEGLVFDNNGRYCNAPEFSESCDDSSSPSGGNDGSSGGSSSGGECTREGFFRNPEDCTKYYQCSRNENSGGFDRSDHTCPDGRIFDEGSSYCNDPELSEQPCDSDSNSESTTSGGSSTDSSSSGGESTTSSAGTRGSGGQCTQEGFYRNPDDCNKFYRCVDFSGSGESFVRYDFDCPEGLHFDEVNSVCNWPSMTPPCESNSEPPAE